jgi:LysM repeat protein
MSVGLLSVALLNHGCKSKTASSEAVHNWPPQDIDETDSYSSSYANSSTPAPDPDFVPGKSFYPANKPVVQIDSSSSTTWDPGPVPDSSTESTSEFTTIESYDSAPMSTSYASSTAPSFGPGSTHTVVKGDTLFGLARSYYNNPGRWRDIYDANRTTLGNNPNVLRVGQSLVIP